MDSNSIPEAQPDHDRCMYCGKAVGLKDLKDGEAVYSLHRKPDPSKHGKGKFLGMACDACGNKDNGVHSRKQ